MFKTRSFVLQQLRKKESVAHPRKNVYLSLEDTYSSKYISSCLFIVISESLFATGALIIRADEYRRSYFSPSKLFFYSIAVFRNIVLYFPTYFTSQYTPVDRRTKFLNHSKTFWIPIRKQMKINLGFVYFTLSHPWTLWRKLVLIFLFSLSFFPVFVFQITKKGKNAIRTKIPNLHCDCWDKRRSFNATMSSFVIVLDQHTCKNNLNYSSASENMFYRYSNDDQFAIYTIR